MGAHSVLEFDEVRLLHSLGHEVFSPGAFIHPGMPLDDIRPPLPDVPEYPTLIAAVDALGQPHDHVARHLARGEKDCSVGHNDTLAAAKMHLPDEVLEWADALIFAAWEHTWLVPEWDRLRDKRIIWRTIGQSGDHNESMMAPLVRQGVEVVRYSPKEANIPGYAGETTLIRFGKDPNEWNGWTGEDAIVTNVTQALYRRGDWCGYPFWEAVTRGLPRIPMGGESENIGGTGALPPEAMLNGLRKARVYVYTGTQPASYTLGMIEAGMTGIPLVSIGPAHMRILPYGHLMFEGHELIERWSNDPTEVRVMVERFLDDPDHAAEVSIAQRERFIDLFGLDKVTAQWGEFLGAAVPARELVAA